jgi:hypothetical protein
VNYTLAAIAFAVFAFQRASVGQASRLSPSSVSEQLSGSGIGPENIALRRGFKVRDRRDACPTGWLPLSGIWLAVLAAALSTGAKLSNAPLLLPLGCALLPALGRVKWLNWKLAPLAVLVVCCSCLPVAIACWRHTGDFTGDPDNQFKVRPRNAVGAVLGNLVELAQDATQPPLLPGRDRINALLEPLNQSAAMQWVIRNHSSFGGICYSQAVYEGEAGLGCGIWFYAVFLAAGCRCVETGGRQPVNPISLPPAWRVAPWLGVVAFLILYARLAADHTQRFGAAFYPLLFILLLRWRRVAAFERRRVSAIVAGCVALAVLPPIMLTQARPLIPIERLAQWFPTPALKSAAAQYHIWTVMRDDLAPLRAQVPPEATRLGYAAGFRDTPYGLWQPFGSRTVVELGLPPGSGNPVPRDIKYAVVTERGLRERGQPDLQNWLRRYHGEVIFTLQRSRALSAHEASGFEAWYLVKLEPPAPQLTL